jgi:hypothetical protein
MELRKEDLTALAAAGIAIFHNRVIYNAQLPLDKAVIARVAEVCSGPLPEEIVQLWRIQELDELHARGAIDKRLLAVVAQIHHQATIPRKDLPASS